jgi:Undecaprenyl-phosphate galactose phosphotransferase WbaP
VSTRYIETKPIDSKQRDAQRRDLAAANNGHGNHGDPDAHRRQLSMGFGLRYSIQALVTSLPLFVADITALWCVVWLVSTLFFAGGAAQGTLFGIAVFSGASIWAQPLIGLAIGLYPGVGLPPAAELRLTSIASSLWIALLACLLLMPESGGAAALLMPLGLTWLLVMGAVPIARLLARRYASRYSWWGQPAVILGGGPDAALVYQCLQAHRYSGLRPLGIIDDPHSHRVDRFVEPSWFLGPLSAAKNIVDKHGVFWGIIPVGSQSSAQLAALLDRHAAILPHLLLLREGAVGHRAWNGARDCGGLASLRVDERLLLPAAQFVKRSMDIVISLMGIIALLPLIAVIMIAVKRSSPGPIFYGQQRLGIGGKKFRAWKFRSMIPNADAVLKDFLAKDPELRAEWERDHKLRNDPRVTAVGRLLRKTSFDELPQLWNVVVGEMSLVGPRPIVEAERVKYGEAYPLYQRVRPGITGLWQVSGRNNTTYEERVQLDLAYTRNWSPWQDLYLLARTFRVVLLGEGAY